jgi:hypothetical protein
VASTKEHFEEIDRRLSSIERRLGISIEAPKASSFWPKTLTEWAQVVGVGIVIVTTAVGLTLYLGGLMVDRHILLALVPVRSDIGQIKTDVAEIKGELGDVRLKELSASPADPQNNKDAQNVLRTARLNDVRLGDRTIADAGERFVEAAASNPEAWNTALEFLSYRAYLNSVTIPLGPQTPLSANVVTHYVTSQENFPQGIIRMSVMGASKTNDAADLGTVSTHGVNRNLAAGPSLLIAETPALVLDNLYAKRVLFVNSRVIYRGGPIDLENVYFLNCTFEIENQPKGQELAKQILSAQATSFLSG